MTVDRSKVTCPWNVNVLEFMTDPPSAGAAALELEGSPFQLESGSDLRDISGHQGQDTASPGGLHLQVARRRVTESVFTCCGQGLLEVVQGDVVAPGFFRPLRPGLPAVSGPSSTHILETSVLGHTAQCFPLPNLFFDFRE